MALADDIRKMAIRLEKEKLAKEALSKAFTKYIQNTHQPSMNFEQWKDALLIQFMVTAMDADKAKGEGI